MEGISSFNSIAVFKYFCETKTIFGLQLDIIDFNSCFVNFISSGIKVVPAITDAKNTAPNSTFDSDIIAIFSSLATFRSLIK